MNENEKQGMGGYQTAFLLGRIAEYTGSGDLLGHAQELLESPILSEFETAVAPIEGWHTKQFPSLWDFRTFRIALYALVRSVRPERVVETGVLHGMTSAFLLEALAKNGAGKLLSVDLPSYFEEGPANKDGYDATLPKGCQPGWIIPKRLKGAWDLKLGPSLDVLRSAKDLDAIDLFLHDSEHTYPTMWQELSFAWERLTPGGLLVCDNVEATTAFYDFCRGVGYSPLVLSTPSDNMSYAPRFAMIRKDV